jgi:hypothetical protein
MCVFMCVCVYHSDTHAHTHKHTHTSPEIIMDGSASAFLKSRLYFPSCIKGLGVIYWCLAFRVQFIILEVQVALSVLHQGFKEEGS